MMKEQKLFLSS